MINLRTRRAKEREHAVQDRLRETIVRPFIRALESEFDKVAKDVKRLGISHVALVSVHHNHKVRLKAIFKIYYSRIMYTFGGRVRTHVKSYLPALITKADSEDIFASDVANFTEKWSAKNVDDISDTTIRKIQRIIKEGVTNGDTTSDIASEIEDALGSEGSSGRARTIARTETHAASQDAGFNAAQNLGLDLVKQWIAVEDARTRETHADADEQIVNMEDEFEVGEDHLLYPGDPSGSPEEVIQCRCVAVYLSADKKEDSNNEDEEEDDS